jgi:hypothetical protein
MVSRYRGESASALHQSDRNFTCTETKLSKTNVVLVHVPNPWLDESFLGNGLHAPLRFAPTGVRSGTHSWPDVPTGKHLKGKSFSRRTTRVSIRRREADKGNGLRLTNSDST